MHPSLHATAGFAAAATPIPARDGSLTASTSGRTLHNSMHTDCGRLRHTAPRAHAADRTHPLRHTCSRARHAALRPLYARTLLPTRCSASSSSPTGVQAGTEQGAVQGSWHDWPESSALVDANGTSTVEAQQGWTASQGEPGWDGYDADAAAAVLQQQAQRHQAHHHDPQDAEESDCHTAEMNADLPEQQRQHPRPPSPPPPSLERDKAITTALCQCHSFGEVLQVLQHFYTECQQASLAHRQSRPQQPRVRQQQLPEPSLTAISPASLLTPLNHRHLAVLWITLARVVEEQEDRGSTAPSRQHPPRQQHHHHQQQHSPPLAPAANSGPLTRVELVELRRLMALLERATLPCMGSGTAGAALQVSTLRDPQGVQAAGAAGNNGAGNSSSTDPAAPLTVHGTPPTSATGQVQRERGGQSSGGVWSFQDMANTLSAMGRLGHVPSDRWLSSFVQASLPCLPAAHPRHLAQALWGLGSLELPPGQAWMHAALARGLQLVRGRAAATHSSSHAQTSSSSSSSSSSSNDHEATWSHGAEPIDSTGATLILWSAARLAACSAEEWGADTHSQQPTLSASMPSTMDTPQQGVPPASHPGAPLSSSQGLTQHPNGVWPRRVSTHTPSSSTPTPPQPLPPTRVPAPVHVPLPWLCAFLSACEAAGLTWDSSSEPQHASMVLWALGCLAALGVAPQPSRPHAAARAGTTASASAPQGFPLPSPAPLQQLQQQQRVHQRSVRTPGLSSASTTHPAVHQASPPSPPPEQPQPTRHHHQLQPLYPPGEGHGSAAHAVGNAQQVQQQQLEIQWESGVTAAIERAAAWGTALGPQGVANALWAAAKLQLAARLSERQSLQQAQQQQQQAQHVQGLGHVQDTQQHHHHQQQQQWQGRRMHAMGSLVAICEQVMPAMQPQQLANAAWALAVLQLKPGPSPAFLQRLLQYLKPSLLKLPPQGLSYMLWACVRLGCRPSLDWMLLLVQASTEQSSAFCPHSLPLLLWSLGRIGYSPGRAWARILLGRSLRLLPAFSPQSYATTLISLARLSLPPPPEWTKLALENTRQHMLAVVAAHEADEAQEVLQLQGLQQKRRLKQAQQRLAKQRALQQALGFSRWSQLMKPMELSMILQGTARLGMQPTRLWLATAEHAVLAMLQTPASRAPAQLSGVSTSVGGGVKQQGSARTGMRFVAGALYALARLGHSASDALLQAATAQLLAQPLPPPPPPPAQGQAAAHATAHAQWGTDLAQALWSLAMLGHRPTPEQLDALAQRVLWCLSLEQHLPEAGSSSSSSSGSMGSHEVAQAAWALSSMGWRPPVPWVAAFLRATQPLLPTATLLSTVTLLRVLVGWGGRCANAEDPASTGNWSGQETDGEGHYHGSAGGSFARSSGVAASSGSSISSASSVSSIDSSIDSLDEEGLPPMQAAAGLPPAFLIPQPWLDTAAHVVEACSQIVLAAPAAAVRARGPASAAQVAAAPAAAAASSTSSMPPPPAAGAAPGHHPAMSAAGGAAQGEQRHSVAAPAASHSVAAPAASHSVASHSVAAPAASPSGQAMSASAHGTQPSAGHGLVQRQAVPLGLQALAPSPPFRVSAIRNATLSMPMGRKKQQRHLMEAERAPRRHWMRAVDAGREALAASGHPVYVALRLRQLQLQRQQQEQKQDVEEEWYEGSGDLAGHRRDWEGQESWAS